jgi:hypothetical protein
MSRGQAGSTPAASLQCGVAWWCGWTAGSSSSGSRSGWVSQRAPNQAQLAGRKLAAGAAAAAHEEAACVFLVVML